MQMSEDSLTGVLGSWVSFSIKLHSLKQLILAAVRVTELMFYKIQVRLVTLSEDIIKQVITLLRAQLRLDFMLQIEVTQAQYRLIEMVRKQVPSALRLLR